MDDRTVTLSQSEFQAIVAKATADGTRKALRELGLDDKDARKDIDDMRSLIEAWRIVRKSMLREAAKWVAIAVLGFLAGRLH